MNPQLKAFESYLEQAQKSAVTREKYLRDVRAFLHFQGERPLERALLLAYKQKLLREDYAPRSINSMLSALQCYCRFQGKNDCRVKRLRLPGEEKREENELSRKELSRLLAGAKKKERLYLLLRVFSETGARFPELSRFTMEALESGSLTLEKGRKLPLSPRLRKELLAYAKKKEVQRGCIFLSRKGHPLNRSNIWHEMKDLSIETGVDPHKISARSLRAFYLREQAKKGENSN